MMKYKDIIKMDSPYIRKSIEMVSDFLDSLDCEDEIEEFLIEQLGMFNNMHFDERTANYIIDHMSPAVGHTSVCDILKMNGVDVYKAKEHIRNAYQKAVLKASEHGWEAPRIPEKYNEWDYYITFAMIMADNWISVDGELEKAAMLAYEFMSDPDSDCSKVWNYFF